MNFSWIAVAESVTSTVGASVAQQYTVIAYPQGLEAIIAAGPDVERNGPTTLFNVDPVLGVDFPFSPDLEHPWLWEPPLDPFAFANCEDLSLANATAVVDETVLIMIERLEFAAVIQAHLDLHAAAIALGHADNFDPFPGFSGQLAYSDTVCRILEEIQRHLLEPVIDEGVSWQLWTESEVRASFQERVERFLLETGLTRERITVSGITINQFLVTIPEEVIQIRRVQWVGEGGERSTLLQRDEQQLDNSEIGWRDATGTPTAYFEAPQPSLTVQLYPRPTEAGRLELIVVKRPTLTACAAMPIPAMFSPYIKWGVLADLLVKEGEANDPERAQYAEKRYLEGIDLGRAMLGSKE